jgi:hypothetical protein
MWGWKKYYSGSRRSTLSCWGMSEEIIADEVGWGLTA